MPESAHAWIWGTLAHLPLLTKQRGFRGMLLNMTGRKRVLKEALALPDLVLTHSQFVQGMFARHTSVPIQVLRYGHDFAWHKDYHGKTKADQLRFGYLGQIQMTKGVHVLIEAFQKAGLAGRARLDIWGDVTKDPTYVQRLQALIGDNQSIVLRGRFERDQLAPVLADIDVLVVPSIWYENAPLVIHEAFATGTPVIATNLGGMAEAISQEVSGLLFKRGDVDDLAKQLRRILEEPGLLERLQAGVPPVKRVEEEVTELERIYQSLIAHP